MKACGQMINYWLPHILKGEKLEANFLFGKGDEVLEHNIKIID